MKKLFGILFVIFLFVPVLVFADPHLTADPQANVTHYVITGDINVTVPAFDLGNDTVKLWLDLAGISSGTYQIDVKAKNIWGESVATPFDFTKAVPGAVTGVRIE